MKKDFMYSKIIAGTMTWGSWGKQLSKMEMDSLMHQCLELKITTFDHADIYGGYTNEADFGNALNDSGIDRESIQLISKCGIKYVCEARDYQLKHYDYSKEYIIWSADQSLKNLKTEYLDLFLLHRPSPLMNADTIADAVDHLKSAGKIKTFGVSNFTPSQIAMLEKTIPVTGNQVELSLTSHKVMYDGTLDDCLAHGRMAMSWSPLGDYYKQENEQVTRIKQVISALQEKYQAGADQLLLAWVLKHPAQVHPVVGTTSPERLAAAVAAMAIDLETEDWFQMLTASQGHRVP